MLEALNKSVTTDANYQKPLILRAALHYKLNNYEDSLKDYMLL